MRTSVPVIAIVLSVLVGWNLLAVPTAQAGQTVAAKLDPSVLTRFDAEGKVRVVVRFADAVRSSVTPAGPFQERRGVAKTAAQRAELAALQARLVADLSTRGPLAVHHRFTRYPMLALTIDRTQLGVLMDDPKVLRILPDHLLVPHLASSLPFLGAAEMHDQGIRGAGTAVAILDTPVHYWKSDFGSCSEPGVEGCAVKVWMNFAGQDIDEVADRTTHGTNVAGISLGVAPETDILALNVFEYIEGMGFRAYSSTTAAALEWVAENATTYNIVAANMSLGSDREDPAPCNGDSVYLDPILDLWHEHGVLVSISSGNENRDNSVGSPACISMGVATGAQFDEDVSMIMGMGCSQPYPVYGEVTCFSNMNGMLDFIAPGIWVDAGGLDNFGGTSMAAPHVAGAVALFQSGWLAGEGAFRSAPWALASMQMTATPNYYEGWSFMELNLRQSGQPDWDRGWHFSAYDGEDEAAEIPLGDDSLTLDATIEGLGGTANGVYLKLEVIHNNPQNVTATLTAPSGAQASVTLPNGFSNFNGVIGRHWFPGAFAALADSPVDGQWQLELSDGRNAATAGEEIGYYLNATLFFTTDDCVPSCEGRDCGDDRCGGLCGECADGRHCNFRTGACVLEGEYCPGDSCAGAVELPVPASDTFTGDTSLCAYDDAGDCGGDYTPEQVFTFTFERPGYIAATSTGYDTLLYLRRDTCDGEEVACNNNHDDVADRGSRIETELETGTYYLFVDGGIQSGPFDLQFEACMPDCDGRDCGDDGCGGNCGDCGDDGTCGDDGQCCVPDCEDRDCGDDGCGGLCGECADGVDCVEGLCAEEDPDGDSDSADANEDGDAEASLSDGDDTTDDGGCRHAGSSAWWGCLFLLPLLIIRRRLV